MAASLSTAGLSGIRRQPAAVSRHPTPDSCPLVIDRKTISLERRLLLRSVREVETTLGFTAATGGGRYVIERWPLRNKELRA